MMRRNLAIAALSIFLVACASEKSQARLELEMSQDAFVQEPGAAPEQKKAGESVGVEELPVLVEAPGYMSLLIVTPPEGAKQNLKVDLKPVSKWGGKSFDATVNDAVVEIVSTVNEIQVLLGSRKADQAYDKLLGLESRYPNLRWLDFLKSSCLIAKGDRSGAKVALESALREYPKDPVGQQLHKILSGGATQHD